MRKKFAIFMIISLFASIFLTGCMNNEDTKKLSPTAGFIYEPSTIWRNKKIFFNSTSYDSDGSINNWTWNFDDGNSSYGESVVHYYMLDGVYNVTLNVRDNDNKNDYIEKKIIIYKHPPLYNISLRLNDFPREYVLYLESYNSTFGFNFSIPVYEVYNEQFIYKDPENNSGFPMIITTFCRFNSSADAEAVMIKSSGQMANTFNKILNCISEGNNITIGNHSIYRLYQGSMGKEYNYQNASWSYVYFRMQNILVLILLDEVPSSDIDYEDLTFQYARIIEDRLNNYLDV